MTHLRFLLFLWTFLFSFGSVFAEDLLLAEVQGEPLTLEYLRFIFSEKHQGHTGMIANEHLLKDFLNGIIEERLLIQEAYHLELDKDVEKSPSFQMAMKKLLKEDQFKEKIQKKVVISKEMVEEAYEKLGVRYHGRRMTQPSREEAYEMYKKLQDGEPFEELAREHSIDKASKYGGDLGWISWGVLDESLEKRLMALEEGQFCQPFETEDGWIILLLEEKKSSPLPEFRKISNQLRSILRKRRIKERKEQFYRKLYLQYDVSIRGSLIKKDLFLKAASQEGKQDFEKIPVATFQDEKILFGDLVRGLNVHKIADLSSFEAERKLRHRLENMIDEALLDKWILEQDVSSEGRKKIKYLKEKLMLENLYHSYMMKGIAISGRDIEDFYLTHKKDFEAPESVRLRVIKTKRRKDLERARERVLRGEDFAAVAAEISEDRMTAERGGDMGWIRRGYFFPELDEEIFSLHPGGMTKIIDCPDGFKIFKVEERKEKFIRPLDKVRESIKKRLMRQKGRDRRRRWISTLKKEARIIIHEENIREAARYLEKEFRQSLKERSINSKFDK